MYSMHAYPIVAPINNQSPDHDCIDINIILLTQPTVIQYPSGV